MLSIEVQGDKQLEIALKGVASDLSDFRRAWRPVSDEVYSIVRAQFATEGGRSGNRWPPRAASTLRNITSTNRRGFKSLGLPLRASDAMFLALTTRGAPSGIYQETEDSLTLGTSLPYARLHQTGTRRMPARKLYDPTEDDPKRIGRIIQRSFKKPIEDRGFDYKDDGGEIPF